MSPTPPRALSDPPGPVRADASGVGAALRAAVTALGGVLEGKGAELELAVACLVARGHLLLEDVPGTGKTTLARALAEVFGLGFARVQFTADLLPSDLVGQSVPDGRGGFEYRRGPIFAQVVLADELNRTPPRTQSALLEAMSDGAVTVDGVRHELPRPFFVVATQNPVSFEGTYPLPESQLDRFLVRLRLGYPPLASERAMLRARRATPAGPALGVTLPTTTLLEAMHATEQVHVDPRIEDDLLRIVHSTRSSPAFALGASPRAALDLDRLARALAVLDGRAYCVPDDVRRAAVPVLAHRLVPAERLPQDLADPDPVAALLADELERLPLIV